MNNKLKSLRSQKHPLRFLWSRILWRSGFLEICPIRFQKGEYFLRMFPASLATQLWIDRFDRESDTVVLKSLLTKGDTYVDVGSNIGQLAIEARLIVGDEGKVTAIEAHPRIAAYLRENLRINKLNDVRVANVAIGDTIEWVRFSDIRSDDQNAVSDRGEILVPCLTLDSMPISLPITLLKIDVEGFEKFVLLGAMTALEQTDYIYFEAWDKHFSKFGYTFRDIYNILHSKGFELGKIDESSVRIFHRDQEIPECTNLLAFRSRDALKKRTGWEIKR